MKVLLAASEATPYVKTGGLADVSGALLREYREMNMEAYLMLPLYRTVRERFKLKDTGLRIKVPIGGTWAEGRIFSHERACYFLQCDQFFDRADLYGAPEGDYPDNAERFAFFCLAVLEGCRLLGLRPDVIHCNDWQTGLVPLYLKTVYHTDFFSSTATLLTVHNLGYQGLFDVSRFPATGLPWTWFNPEGLEFYGKINFLKAGLIASDIITTVSDTYAREVLTPEYGFGLDGVLRKRSSDLYGVINGIDMQEWNPHDDASIAAQYDASHPAGKAACKEHLVRECSLNAGEKNAPVVSMIGRLSAQKGIDIFSEAADEIVSLGARLIVLGKGDEHYQTLLLGLGEKHKGAVFVKIGYDEAFAHRIYAGSDLLLMPSHYEPCGLSQLVAMRYGTVPVARKTGGLADTIADYEPLRGRGTGFLFQDYTASSLAGCFRRALCVYADRRRWKKVVTEAMGMDFSWRSSAMKYIGLYKKAGEGKRLLQGRA
jgi:starch synthase